MLWDFEKRGGRRLDKNRRRYLHEFLDKNELLDLGFQGSSFTQRGTRADRVVVQERLDRGLINVSWQETWPNSQAIHLPAVGSDHCPILILTETNVRRGFKLFKFEAFWASDPECRKVVDRSWGPCNPIAPRFSWDTKLGACRNELKQWSDGKFQNNRKMATTLLSELNILQQDWEENTKKIKEVERSLNQVWRSEELYWKQRAKTQWLKHGDANTAFFHNCTIQKR